VPYGGIDTVLVMPRGNLEGTCPRLLVLAAIAEALDAAAFSTAWELAVTHRWVLFFEGGEGGVPEGGAGTSHLHMHFWHSLGAGSDTQVGVVFFGGGGRRS
jgi:hypothetical protein